MKSAPLVMFSVISGLAISATAESVSVSSILATDMPAYTTQQSTESTKRATAQPLNVDAAVDSNVMFTSPLVLAALRRVTDKDPNTLRKEFLVLLMDLLQDSPSFSCVDTHPESYMGHSRLYLRWKRLFASRTNGIDPAMMAALLASQTAGVDFGRYMIAMRNYATSQKNWAETAQKSIKSLHVCRQNKGYKECQSWFISVLADIVAACLMLDKAITVAILLVEKHKNIDRVLKDLASARHTFKRLVCAAIETLEHRLHAFLQAVIADMRVFTDLGTQIEEFDNAMQRQEANVRLLLESKKFVPRSKFKRFYSNTMIRFKGIFSRVQSRV
ncbi:hypothetical protein O5D80_002867 [Batrachochytrium dendrobatidis]|nr:hypothetical protein O5D80_002867 [Batrachochytrium dendrobatidis]